MKQAMVVPHSRPTIGQEDIGAVAEVLASGMIAQGEKVKEFEDAVARFVGTKYAVAVSSGTSALHLALLGLGVERGDEVIMPSYVCSSPCLATLHATAVPKIVDIDEEGFNISALSVEKQMSLKTKAIIAPHMFGTPCDLDELLKLNVPIIEDCAQSLGAEYKASKVGSFGDLAVLSFYATKMITTGEGGMILTDTSEFYEKIIDARDYDKKPPKPLKYNYKMTDFQAALGLSQLRKLRFFVERRRKIASLYSERLLKVDAKTPILPLEKSSVFFRYVIMLEEMETVQQNIKKRGVICERPVYAPLHTFLPSPACPNSEAAHGSALSIPLYPSLTDIEAEYVVSNLENILERRTE